MYAGGYVPCAAGSSGGCAPFARGVRGVGVEAAGGAGIDALRRVNYGVGYHR